MPGSLLNDRITGLGASAAIKAPCRVATTANLTELVGLLAVDGITLADLDRVLVKSQTDQADNGIYIASTGAWTRARDCADSRDLVNGCRVYVTSGNSGPAEYRCTTANPVLIGSSSIAFAAWLTDDIITDLETVAPIAAAVSTVAANIDDVNTVAASISSVNTVAARDADIAIVAARDADIATVAARDTDVGTLAALDTEITALGAITAAISSVYANIASVVTAAANVVNIDIVAGIAAAVTTVAGIAANVTAVAGSATNINAVAANEADIDAVAANGTDIDTVAAAVAAVNTVSTNIADVNTVAANIGTISAKLAKDGSEAMTGALPLTEVATPSTPASGIKLLYPKSDGKLYTLDDAGLEVEVGAGGGVTSEPIVIFSTGQSNFFLEPAFSWTPAPNLSKWNYDKTDETDVGTAFAAPGGTTISAPEAFAQRVALAHPNSEVYLINIPCDGQAISKWMTGAPTPDMYAACKDNVEAALALISLDKVDIFLWWQGEGDASSPASYVANWTTVHTRFRAETWFPYTTPVVIFGVSILAGASYVSFNTYLSEAASLEAQLRTFVHTGLLPTAYWDSSGGVPYIHMLADGYHAAGNMAYEMFSGAGRWAALPTLYFNPEGNALNLGSLTNPQRVLTLWNNAGQFQFQAVNSGDRLRILSGAGDLVSLTRQATLATADTVLSIRCKGTGSAGLAAVTLGAIDSGGSGFRLLRVPN